MKIGDKVRFLNATGGGVIARFDKGNVVVVTDDDGFDVPTLASELVVVGETTSLNLPKRNTPEHEYAFESNATNEDVEIDPADLPITFKPRPIEREGGDVLNVFLAFLPSDASNLFTSAVEIYLINDTNYYLTFTYMQRGEGVCTLLNRGELEPNTKLLIDTKLRSELSDLEHLHFQGLTYKFDSDFVPLPIIDIAIKLDLKKLYKQSSFTETIFFDTPAFLYDLAVNDHKTFTTEQRLKTLQNGKYQEVGIASTKASHNISYQPKKQVDGMLVVDLHANALLDTEGLTAADLLAYQVEYFKQIMEEYKKKSGQKIVFIHGKGEGVLRKAIITELRRHYKRCYYQDASFAEYGFGATQITIH